MIREKIEIRPALKAQDYKEGAVVKSQVPIKDIIEVETRFGEKSVLVLEDGDSIFLNAASNNSLIDAFGKESDIWKGKFVSIVCEKDTIFNKLMLVVKPLTATKY